MSPVAYAIVSTLVLVMSLIASGWLLYVSIAMPLELYIASMVLASGMAAVSLVVGYREWLRNQHTGRRIVVDRRRLRRVIPVSGGMAILAWVLVGMFFEVWLVGQALFSLAVGIGILLTGSLVSMRPETGEHPDRTG